MQITVFFLIASFSLSLLLAYILSHRSIPLAAGFLLIGVCQGLIFKPLLLLLAGNGSFIEGYILSSISLSEFWLGGTAFAVAICLIVIIMFCLELAFGNRTRCVAFNFYKQPRSIYFDTVVCRAFSGLGVVALIYFLAMNPSLFAFEGKNSLATQDLSDYSGSGIMRMLIGFNYIVVFFMIHNIAVSFRVRRSKVIAVIAGIVFLVYTVLSGSRAAILFSVMSWAVFAYMLGFRLPRLVVVLSSITLISLVVGVSWQRISSSESSIIDNVMSVLANFAGKNFIDITKTVEIYNSQFELRGGSTFIDMFLILIPRSIFPEKTAVNIDTLIAAEIFGNHSYGSGAVPPGLIGEMLFNFGWIGIPLGLVLTGVIIWAVDFWAYRGRSLYLMFYVMTLYSVGVAILGSSFQSTLIGFFMLGLPLFCVHITSSRRFRG